MGLRAWQTGCSRLSSTSGLLPQTYALTRAGHTQRQPELSQATKTPVCQACHRCAYMKLLKCTCTHLHIQSLSKLRKAPKQHLRSVLFPSCVAAATANQFKGSAVHLSLMLMGAHFVSLPLVTCSCLCLMHTSTRSPHLGQL